MPDEVVNQEPIRKTVTFSDSINYQFISKNRRGNNLRRRINIPQKENYYPLLDNISSITFSTAFISSQNPKSILKKPTYVSEENSRDNVTDSNETTKNVKGFADCHEIDETFEVLTNFTNNTKNMSSEQESIHTSSSKDRENPTELMDNSSTVLEWNKLTSSLHFDSNPEKNEPSEKPKFKIFRKKNSKGSLQASDYLITKKSLRSSKSSFATRSSNKLKKPVESPKVKSASRVTGSSKLKSEKSCHFPIIVMKPKKKAAKKTAEKNPKSESTPASANFPKFDFYFNKRFYDYLIAKMKSKFGSRTNDEVVELAKYIDEVVSKTIKTELGFQDLIQTLKMVLFQKNVIVTNYDFYEFCMDYLPPRFSLKSIPMAPPFPNAEFDPKTAWCAVE